MYDEANSDFECVADFSETRTYIPASAGFLFLEWLFHSVCCFVLLLYAHSSTLARPPLTFPSSCCIWCGPMLAIWQDTSSKMRTNSLSLLWMCCTTTQGGRLRHWLMQHTVAASWTKPLEEGCSLMSHVRNASMYHASV